MVRQGVVLILRCCYRKVTTVQPFIQFIYDGRINCSEELLILKIRHICDMKRDFFFLKVSLSYKLAITFDAATCIFTSMYKEGYLAAAETSMKTVLLVTTKF